MKKLSFLLSLGLMALLALPSAQAGAIAGSQVIDGVAAITEPLGGTDLMAATSLSVTMQTNTLPGAQTGDYVGIPSSTFTATLNTASLSSFTYGNAAFGTFTAMMGVEEAAGTNARTFAFVGTFVPGTDFPAGLTQDTASIVIQFSQAGGPGNSISLGGTQHTPAVPEPASLALAGIGLSFVSLFRGLRKRKLN